jgi:hypothetical protein
MNKENGRNKKEVKHKLQNLKLEILPINKMLVKLLMRILL